MIITLDEAKEYLRIDTDWEDNLFVQMWRVLTLKNLKLKARLQNKQYSLH